MEKTLTWNYPINGGADRTIIYVDVFFFQARHVWAPFSSLFSPAVLFRWTSRLSVGIEDAQDLILDLEQAIKALGAAWEVGNLQALWSQHHCGNCQSSKREKGWSFLIWGSHDIDFIYIYIYIYIYHSYRVGKDNRPDTSRDQVAAGELCSTPHGGFDSEFQVRVPSSSNAKLWSPLLLGKQT